MYLSKCIYLKIFILVSSLVLCDLGYFTNTHTGHILGHIVDILGHIVDILGHIVDILGHIDDIFKLYGHVTCEGSLNVWQTVHLL